MQWTLAENSLGCEGIANGALVEALERWIDFNAWLTGKCTVCSDTRLYCNASGVYQVDR